MEPEEIETSEYSSFNINKDCLIAFIQALIVNGQYNFRIKQNQYDPDFVTIYLKADINLAFKIQIDFESILFDSTSVLDLKAVSDYLNNVEKGE